MWALFVFTLTQVTSSLAKPGPGQLVCYLVTDVDANYTNTVYSAVTDEKLYDRGGTHNPLPSCSSSPAPELSPCVVCQAEEQVFVQCLLTDPSAHLNVEADRKGEELDKTLILCVSTTTTAPMTTPPPGGDTGRIVGGVLGGLVAVVVVVAAVVLYILWKRSKSCG